MPGAEWELPGPRVCLLLPVLQGGALACGIGALGEGWGLPLLLLCQLCPHQELGEK